MRKVILKVLKENQEHTSLTCGEDAQTIDSQFFEDIAKEIEEELSKDFKTASLPLIKHLCENHHPHVTAIVTPTSTELVEGLKTERKIYDYVVD